MKHSIKTEITAIFIGVIVLLLALIFLVNSSLLAQYYTISKQRDLVEFYGVIDEVLTAGTIDQVKVQDELKGMTERDNLSVVVATVDGEIAFYTERERKGPLFIHLLGYLLGQLGADGDVLVENQSYEILKITDPDTGKDYLEMWGYMSDASVFLIRSPLESIRESAALANQFLIYVGLVAIVFGGVLVWFLSRQITEPLLELTVLSKQMAELDFEARYTRGGKNEIGILGANFNTMSTRLERTVSELKRANNQLQKDIEQKEQMASLHNEFLGNVSHELKTPIALIQGYAEGLKEGIDEDPENRQFYCDVIIDEANKMNQMVKHLLTLNQLEFGAEELIFERFDITALIQTELASYSIMIEQAGVKVDFVADEAVYVWADEFKTAQVVLNYLTNAIHHAAKEKRIEIRILPKGNIVRVTVFNSGNPIPEEDLDRLWDKFYKVDKAHTREYGGNGIGLSIVKAIMESFHQEYGVNNFDNGVEFWFELDAQT